MASNKDYVIPEPEKESGSLPSYVFGFASSIILTLVAYFLAVKHTFNGYTLITVLVELAIVQFVVQLFFFLHFGKGKSAGFKLLTLVLMIFFVIVVVLGSIWIMSNLNYNMSPKHINQYMLQQSAEGF